MLLYKSEQSADDGELRLFFETLEIPTIGAELKAEVEGQLLEQEITMAIAAMHSQVGFPWNSI